MKEGISRNQLNLYLDIGVFLIFLVATTPRATGTAIHEWISILFLLPFLIHILLHWKWIGKITRKFLQRLPGETRFNYLLNLILFVLITLVTFSGLVVSEAVLPLLGFPHRMDRFWFAVHEVTADVLLVILGIHLAMHWDWLVRTVKRLVSLKPISRPEAEA